MEEKGIVALDCLPSEPRCPLTRPHRLESGQRASRRWCLTAVVPRGGGQQAAGLWRETSRATIPFSSLSPFMYFRESKPKCLPPNSFSTIAEISPTTSLVVEIPETSENPTSYAPLHQQQNGHPNNKVVYNSRSSLSHWRAEFSGREEQRRGGNPHV